jgi:hypothetical protein
MKLRFLVLCAVLFHAAPAAAWDWWQYFDRLSGPGPFNSTTPWMEVRLASWQQPPDIKIDKVTAVMSDDPDALTLFPVFRVMSLDNSSNHHMFQDQPDDRRTVNIMAVDFALMLRLRKVLGINLRGNVDVGVGMSVLHFSGDGFNSFNRVGLLPKITATPFAYFASKRHPLLAEWLRVPKLYADWTVVGGFDGHDFGNAATTFSTDAEVLHRHGVIVDAQTMFDALVRSVR